MGNIFRVINSNGDIKISICKKANAVFKTNEYDEMENICIHEETINIFDLLKENKELKEQNEFLMERENKLQAIEMKEKKFINYLISLSNGYSKDGDGIKETIINKIMRKYKQIIGDDKE